MFPLKNLARKGLRNCWTNRGVAGDLGRHDRQSHRNAVIAHKASSSYQTQNKREPRVLKCKDNVYFKHYLTKHFNTCWTHLTPNVLCISMTYTQKLPSLILKFDPIKNLKN